MTTGKIIREGVLKDVKVEVIESWAEGTYPHFGTRFMKVKFIEGGFKGSYNKGDIITIPAYDFEEYDPFIELVKQIKPLVNTKTKDEIRGMFISSNTDDEIHLAYCFAQELMK